LNLKYCKKTLDFLHNRTEEVISIIGAGRLGRPLAFAIGSKGIVIDTIVDIDPDRARECQDLCGAREISSDPCNITDDTTMIIISVPDQTISGVVSRLSESRISYLSDRVICHTSGLLTSDVLYPLKTRGNSVCSFHPCFTFIGNHEVDFSKIYFAMEGDPEGVDRIESIISRIGGRGFIISKSDKVLYHAACSMASNCFVSLLKAVKEIVDYVDLPGGLDRLMPLTEGTLQNIEKNGVEQSLTGPVVRGDIETVRNHLDALMNLDKKIVLIYIDLGRVALKIAGKSGLKGREITAFDKMFNEYEKRLR